MRRSSRIAVLAAAGVVALAAFDAPDGKDVFERRCSGCHALDIDKEGPRLRAVFGRKAAGVPGFAYSEALKKSRIVWNEASLERWLRDPDGMVSGTDMSFLVRNEEERDAVVAYLKTLTRK